MSDSLIVVESPTKARTIKRFVGKRFEVAASNGHIKDLPKRELGVEIEGGFEPKYQTIPAKKKVVSQLKKAAEGKTKIYLASDPDREGEAIAWHIAELLKAQGREFLRLLIHEITDEGLRHALKNPAQLDQRKYESQIARRVLDRLVGYKISPLLWRSIKGGLSAGRVQSVALRLIVEREKEIRRFVPKEFWQIKVMLRAESPPEFWAKLIKKEGKKLDIPNEAEAKKTEADLKAQRFTVSKVERREKKKSPPPPFITSTLQQEAYKRFRFAARHTMRLAQELYEGIEVGDMGQTGLITYMRTDSVRVAESAISSVRELIQANFGNEYLPHKPRAYKSRKLAQEAHEAIRPTRLDLSPEAVKQYLNKDQFKLYDLIYKRFVASQMKDARIAETTIAVSAGPYELEAKSQKLAFNGFLAVYEEGKEPEENNNEKEAADTLPAVKEGEVLDPKKFELKQNFTKPKPRYTESSLIRELEVRGIGRPSTYATIIGTLFDREYVQREKGFLAPTGLGEIVSKVLVATFPQIMDVGFTAKMEEELDEIEEGKKEWRELMEEFWQSFSPNLSNALDKMREIRSRTKPTGAKCPKCGGELILKWGKHGEFAACSNFPECKFTSNFSRTEDGQIEIEALNPKPKKPSSIGVQCPKCGGEIAKRKTRKGKLFFGCSNYPKCDFATWYEPYPKPCPECNHPFMEIRKDKLYCPNCKHTEPLEEGE